MAFSDLLIPISARTETIAADTPLAEGGVRKIFPFIFGNRSPEPTPVSATHEITPDVTADTSDVFDKPAVLSDLHEYFRERGWSVTSVGDPDVAAPIEDLAVTLAESYVDCKGFFKYLRTQIVRKNFLIAYCLSAFSESDREKITNLAARMASCGILCGYSATADKIHGRISSAPKVINLLNGGFLEIFAAKKVAEVLEKLSDLYPAEYDIYTNVHLWKEGRAHELDVVFTFDGLLFSVESKSGSFSEYDLLRSVGVELQVNPDRQFLLSAELDEQSAAEVGYLYDCYAGNVRTFSQTLQTMIDMSLIKERNL